jgi:carboxymethylenebutenolidase
MSSRRGRLMLALVLSSASGVRCMAQSSRPETVVVPSGDLKLRALLCRPAGRGPFPAVLFNHGSGHAAGVDRSGRRDQRHPDLIGPVFARHGYLFLYLFRRGDGLSTGQGTPSGDRMDSAAAATGQVARNDIQLHLLETDEMSDALAGLAFLRARSDVKPGRLAVVGVSFGGSLTVLMAERDSTLRAAVAFATAAYSWDRSPPLRARLPYRRRSDGGADLLHSRGERLHDWVRQRTGDRNGTAWEAPPRQDLPACGPHPGRRP